MSGFVVLSITPPLSSAGSDTAGRVKETIGNKGPACPGRQASALKVLLVN